MVGPLARGLAPLLVAASILLASSADAADTQKRFAIKGAGVAPCSKFIELFDSKSNDVLLFAGWISGYLTALNQHMPDTFDLAPWQSTEVLLFIMRDLCQQAPNEQFYRVASGMAGLLAKEKLRALSDVVEMKNGEHRIALPKEVVQQVQQRLKEMNFYSGAIDGAYGPGTQKAITAFQKQQQIPETGVPDQQTLVRMMYQSSPSGGQ